MRDDNYYLNIIRTIQGVSDARQKDLDLALMMVDQLKREMHDKDIALRLSGYSTEWSELVTEIRDDLDELRYVDGDEKSEVDRTIEAAQAFVNKGDRGKD